MTDIDIKTASSIHEIDSVAWDRISNAYPFQSHRWYAFGERVMADCQPEYLLAFIKDNLIASAAFWTIRNEPLPDLTPTISKLLHPILKRWPLFICRSPLSNLSGLVIPEDSQHQGILEKFAYAALNTAARQHASFLIFDFIEADKLNNWPERFQKLTISEPGTYLDIQWSSFDSYIKSRKGKRKQHFRRTQRQAEKIGLQIKHYRETHNTSELLELIHKVEQRHNSSPNPWMQGMLDNLSYVDAILLEASIGNRVVGCQMNFIDNGEQLATGLGLTYEEPAVYFALMYRSLQIACEKQVRRLHWGSGAYEFKRRLGFQLETNNHTVLAGTGTITRVLSHLSRI